MALGLGGDVRVEGCCSGIVGSTIAEGGGAGGVLGHSGSYKLSNKSSTSPSLPGGLWDPAGEGGHSYHVLVAMCLCVEVQLLLQVHRWDWIKFNCLCSFT
jgi:hypothetical protein